MSSLSFFGIMGIAFGALAVIGGVIAVIIVATRK